MLFMSSRKVKRSNKKNGCNSPFVSKKDRKALFNLINNTDWCDEDSVWDCGVVLGVWSVKLRGEILRRSELKEMGEDVI